MKENGWAGHVVHMKDTKNLCKTVVGNL